MGFRKVMRGVNPQRLAGMPSSFLNKAREFTASAYEDMQVAWDTAESQAQNYLDAGSKGQAALINQSKAVTTGVVLILFAVVLIGNYAPEAFDAVNQTGNTENDTVRLTDIPGGDLFQNTGFLLILLMFLVVLVLWALDLI